ncbi:MAG: HAMP domain-containing histidine kinase [Gemmatimonadetes bacterium]|nr:HAMP domain-containing histidine kinase [Gemmatimonadota bacterium]NNM06530.1 HAMP domain-containing histidine kinase [Gemmatimonadota bacterium]
MTRDDRTLPFPSIMFKIKSFQRRILLALLGVGLVPAVILLLVGTGLAQYGVTSAGTAGPWSSVGESGQALITAVTEAEVTDSAVLEASRAHQQALSESLRISRVFEIIAQRVFTLLPLFALVLALVIGGLSFWAARQLSRGFSRPIQDLIGWTELIGQNQPLPVPGPDDSRGVREFARLREALRAMADDLERGRREAIQAAKLRSWTDMARKVAHEIKNPLAPMRMAAITVSSAEDADSKEAGAVLLEEIGRLDEMARTFSQFGRMPEGPPSQVDMTELLELLIQQHEGVGPELSFDTTGDLPLITAHYDALLRSFRNLLLNAMDAAGAEGAVQVRAAVEGDILSVEIQDSGPGIPPDDLGRIWEPEFSTKSLGTGLGLPMVRQTIRAHGGRVEGRNNPQGGAVFLIELPLEGRSPQE